MKHFPALAVAALAVTLAACGGSSSGSKAPDAAKPAAAQATAVPPTEAPKGVTMAQYEALKTGASEAEVKAALGDGACKELSSSEVMGVKSVMWQCAGAEFASNATLTFSDGKLMSKAQFGLK